MKEKIEKKKRKNSMKQAHKIHATPSHPVLAADAIDHAIHAALLAGKKVDKHADQLVCPVATDQHAADNVDDADGKLGEGHAALVDGQGHGLDVELEEDAGRLEGRHLAAVLGDGVLVGQHAALRRLRVVDGGHDVEVVLEAVEVVLGRGLDVVERVDQLWIVLAERQLVDYVAEVEGAVVDVADGAAGVGGIAVADGGDVEVAHDLVDRHAAVDAAALAGRRAGREEGAAPAGGRLEFGLLGVGQHAVDVVFVEVGVVGRGQVVGGRAVERGGFLAQQLAGQDVVEGGVLHIDVQRVARHGHRDVEVDLQRVADRWLDRKRLGDGAVQVQQQLAPRQVDAEQGDDDGERAAARRRHAVGLARFCCPSVRAVLGGVGGWSGAEWSGVELRKASKLVSPDALAPPKSSSFRGLVLLIIGGGRRVSCCWALGWLGRRRRAGLAND